MARYVDAVESARVTDADINYDDHQLLQELRGNGHKKSLGNKSLDKFTELYVQKDEPIDSHEGKQILVLSLYILYS